MKSKYRYVWLTLFAFLGLVFSACSDGFVNPGHVENTKTLTGHYDIVVEAFDWGPSVSRAILTLEQPIARISPDAIRVTEMMQGKTKTERAVKRVYLSDQNGVEIESPSQFVTVELTVGPQVGSSLVGSSQVVWSAPYRLSFTLTKEVISGGSKVRAFQIQQDFAKRRMPQADRFIYDTYTASADGTKYSYAAYELPRIGQQNQKRPLIVWLHGGAEGGTDASMAVLGARATALIENPIQSILGGAYVLIPQAKTMWMDGYSTTLGGSSIYTKSLMELIQYYVRSHPNIDSNRIYVGGASNGGFMTVQLITTYPNYFAAAFPICSGYASGTMSDEVMKKILHIPMWFLYSEADTTFSPAMFSASMTKRLQAAGATSLHVSSPEKIVDPSDQYFQQDGVSPYQYPGHFSWIYAFNQKSYAEDDPSLELFHWLSKQRK